MRTARSRTPPLAQKINLSPPATSNGSGSSGRTASSRDRGRSSTKKKLGRGLTCFLALQIKHLHRQEAYQRIEEHLKQLEEIEEIYFLTGRIDYLIKANFRDIDEFREFFITKLSKVQMIERAETFVVVSSAVNPRYNPINVDVKGPGPRLSGRRT